MDEILEMMKQFLDGKIDDVVDFSIDLEDAIYDRYDEVAACNIKVAEILNDNLPEICAECELGMDVAPFMSKIQAEYNKILDVINAELLQGD